MIGTIAVATLTEILREVEAGINLGSISIGAMPGLGDAVLAVLMLLMILFRPKGLMGGKEIAWPFVRQ